MRPSPARPPGMKRWGAPLHDFFLYDWRRENHPRHAMRHAGIALENTRMYFEIEIRWKRIYYMIHMWPLSNTFYRYQESLLVSMVGSSKDLVSVLKLPK
jgi:hypothetical protein